MMVEFLGLSVLPAPGILDLRDLKDRDDSFVSERLKDGYVWRLSPLLSAPPAEPDARDDEVPSLDDVLPIVTIRAIWGHDDDVSRYIRQQKGFLLFHQV
jgi:hypothetical protein